MNKCFICRLFAFSSHMFHAISLFIHSSLSLFLCSVLLYCLFDTYQLSSVIFWHNIICFQCWTHFKWMKDKHKHKKKYKSIKCVCRIKLCGSQQTLKVLHTQGTLLFIYIFFYQRSTISQHQIPLTKLIFLRNCLELIWMIRMIVILLHYSREVQKYERNICILWHRSVIIGSKSGRSFAVWLLPKILCLLFSHCSLCEICKWWTKKR